jgi:hypothetical protein
MARQTAMGQGELRGAHPKGRSGCWGGMVLTRMSCCHWPGLVSEAVAAVGHGGAMRAGGMMVGQGGCAAGVRGRLGVLARKAAGREHAESPLAKSVTVSPFGCSVFRSVKWGKAGGRG